MRSVSLLLAVVGLLTAGCLNAAPTEPAATTAPTVEIDASRPDTAFNSVVTGDAAEADLDATLDAPPRLVAGEWWRIRFSGGMADGVEVVRVVAAVEDEGYLIGMPHEGWFKEVIAYHSPALGDVGLDLSYATHNEVFEPVRFPLRAGDTWDTVFATAKLNAKVESVDGLRATVVFTMPPSSDPMDPLYAILGMSVSGEVLRLVYDASIHEVARFESFIGTYEVVQHGYDFEGWITIPRGEHTAIDYGQFGPVTPGAPVIMRDIPVTGGFNRLTLMHAVFPIAPGVYRVRTVAPDGSEFVTESSATDKPSVKFYEAKDPDGSWKAEDVVAGVGVTYSMGIAYHQYDIRLPDGARRADHSHEVIR